MKRIISLCCVALIFVFSLAAPARADDLSNNMLLDVLEFNTDKIDVQTFTPDNPTITFSLPEKIPVRYVECLVILGGDAPASFVYHGDSDKVMTMEYIGNNMYRLYCTATGSYNRVRITCETSGSTRVTFEQVKIASRPWTHYDIESYCQISSLDYSNVIHYVPSDDINYRLFDTVNVAPEDAAFVCMMYSNDWRKYDYIDFELLLVCEAVTSVTAYIGDTIVPIEVNQWENNNQSDKNDLKDFRIYCRMDLTGLDRTSEDVPCLLVSAEWGTPWLNRIEVIGTNGYVILNDYNFLYYYLNNIVSNLQSGFSSVVNAIRGDSSAGNTFQQEVQQELDELDQAQEVLDSVTKPAIEDIDVSVDQYVSQADIQVLASPMAVFFEGEIFSKVIVMSILLATVSYTLFGKK